MVGDILDEHLRQGAGCAQCWPASATAAWVARASLVQEHVLIGESHYRVRILACQHCAQRFVSVFTEQVDWDGGNDPQQWALAPISPESAAALVLAGEGVTASAISAAAGSGYYLAHDFPSNGIARTRWYPMLTVGPHD